MSVIRHCPYPHPFDEALRRGELETWQQSHKQNKACSAAIADRIKQNASSFTLPENSIQPVLDAFGFHRTAYVLANSVRHSKNPERLTQDVKKWASHISVIPDKDLYVDRNELFSVDCDACLLNQLVGQYRNAVRALGLFDEKQCLPNTQQRNFEGEVIAVSPLLLEETELKPEAQLWLCTGGFGALAGAQGRAVYAVSLCNGEETRWNREDIVGVLFDDLVPRWAREKQRQMQAGAMVQNEAPMVMTM